MPSSAAALLKFRCRPAASNTSRVLSGGSREKRLAITRSYTSMNRISLHRPAPASDDAGKPSQHRAQEGRKVAYKPNFLILMADQLAAAALPAYGNRVAKTPHLDGLAEHSVVFRSAYCNSPLCAPSRFAFMTGRLPSAIGAFDNAAELPAHVPTFAHYLRVAGYRTVLSGKMHFCGPDQLHGFEERVTTDIYPADF